MPVRYPQLFTGGWGPRGNVHGARGCMVPGVGEAGV